MPLDTTSQYLVDDLQGLPLLDGRFEQLQLVNFDSLKDERRGCFSLVFKAFDRDLDRHVALKFFDPNGSMDVYRLTAFRREREILQNLIGVNRCLQLVSGLSKYQLAIPATSGSILHIPCEYFAVDWIDGEVDQYFFCQEQFSAEHRIRVFAAIASSVEILHSKEVFHRDLKPDNLRQQFTNNRHEVIAIDLGTAARFSSSPIQPSYYNTVGAPAYASPEARCGLAGNRRIARYTDLYALGCLLFELFNKDLYIKAFLARNSVFPVVLTALRSQVDTSASEVDQENDWFSAIKGILNSIVPVSIDGAGSDVPRGISPMLDEVLLGLTHVDYRRRPSIAWVRKRMASVLKILSNEKLYSERRRRSIAVRENRIQKIRRQEARLDATQARKLEISHAN